MAAMNIFVSHSHEDSVFCRALVEALRHAGADVWYDEHNMGLGRLGPTIEHELEYRSVFVLILSPSALRSHWVEDETRWAYMLQRRSNDSTRVILPVTASTVQNDDIWLFLRDYKRIEATGGQPYTQPEAIYHTLHALELPLAGDIFTYDAAANYEDTVDVDEGPPAAAESPEVENFLASAQAALNDLMGNVSTTLQHIGGLLASTNPSLPELTVSPVLPLTATNEDSDSPLAEQSVTKRADATNSKAIDADAYRIH